MEPPLTGKVSKGIVFSHPTLQLIGPLYSPNALSLCVVLLCADMVGLVA